MAKETESNRSIICISSSSDEGYDDDEDCYQVDPDENDYYSDSDEEEKDQDEEVFEESDDQQVEEEDHNNGGRDEPICDKLFRLLKEHRDLDSLKLNDCKAYLRKYGLRVTGSKSLCLQRIKDHWRLRDGNGEALYPRSSFVINCTGDVCQGDVVMFWQKVYEKFDKRTRHGRVRGTRVVAGRVVKESYGAEKQQHTFTVEVLWSRGIKRLPPLFPLLVKGRNLYRMRTFRQYWDDEAERRKVLAEKHKRGDAARRERAMKKSKKRPTSDGDLRGTKHANDFPSRGRSMVGKTNESKKGKYYSDPPEKSTLRESRAPKKHRRQSSTFRESEHFKENQKSTRPSISKVPSVQPFTGPPIHHQSQMRSQDMNIQKLFHRQDRNGYQAMPRYPPSGTYADRYVMPLQSLSHFGHSNYSNHVSNNPGYGYDPRTWNDFSFCRPLRPLDSGTNRYWQRR